MSSLFIRSYDLLWIFVRIRKPMQHTRTQNTQQAVLLAATTILIEQGVSGFSVRKVAQEANISLGNLQYHFPTRNHLIHGLFKQISERVALAAGQHETEERQLLAYLDAIFDELDTPVGSIPVWELCSMAAHDPGLADMLHQMFLPLRRRLSRFIATINPGRSTRTCEHQATCIVALIEGSGLFDAHGRSHRSEFRGLRKQIREIIQHIIHTPGTPGPLKMESQA